MKKVLIIYYTQSGQLKDICDSVFNSLDDKENIIVDYYRIKPVQDFPFPWPSDEFFDSMPESVKGIPIELELDDFPSNKDYDLVVLAYQVWYLSPSIPFNSFLLSEKAKDFLRGKTVITILGVRNMWVFAQENVKRILKEYDSKLVGNIVLVDKTNNLVSVATIIKWLIKGNKGPYKYLPEAGVSQKDVRNASRFAKPIEEALLSDNFANLQNELLRNNAVIIKYHIVNIEKTALKIFHLFAGSILKKGKAGDRKRIRKVRLFKYYLLFAIYILFPLASLVHMIRKLLFVKSAKKQIKYYQGI